jgi:cellobiose phosphorylase
MNVWGLFTLLGVEAHPTKGLRIRPCLPRRLSGSSWSMRYHGRRITFTLQGHGTTVQQLNVNKKPIPNPANSPWIAGELLKEGAVIDVLIAR